MTDCAPPPSLFSSFWMGGFESACHINRAGVRQDMIAGTRHDAQADTDYALLRSVGMRAARDAARWHLIDRGGRFDFTSLAAQVRAARRHEVQVIWSMMHYGWPDGLDIWSPAFIARFARYCGAVARYIRDEDERVPFYTPANEISFLAWAGADEGYINPFAKDRGRELKRQVVRAVIAACHAIRDVDPRARFVHVEPLFNVIAHPDRPDLIGEAETRTAYQYEVWDYLSGRAEPELGGAPEYLDIMGVNYYANNQWEVPGDVTLSWLAEPPDPRRLPLGALLERLWTRYRRPLLLAETSHVGVGRARWLDQITTGVAQARHDGIPVEGVCLYPVIDRYDWSNRDHWHNSGLFDIVREPDGGLHRVLNEDYAAALRLAQSELPG